MTCFLHIKLVTKQRNKQIFYLCRYTYFLYIFDCKVKSEINERQTHAIWQLLFKDIIHVSAISLFKIYTPKCTDLSLWNIIDSLISIWLHWKINLIKKIKKRKKNMIHIFWKWNNKEKLNVCYVSSQ